MGEHTAPNGRGGGGGHPGGGARAPRFSRGLLRLLPHVLVLAVVGATVAGSGFWDATLRGQQRFEAETTNDLSVPLSPQGAVGAATPAERAPDTGYFARPPLPITAVRLRIATYETRANETPAQIAARFGLQATTLLWANGLQDPDKPFAAGTKLRVPPVDGMLHQVQSNDTLTTIAAKYRVEPGAITAYRPNDVAGEGGLIPNSYVMVVGGRMPTRERTEQYTVRNGDTLWSIAERFGLQPSTIVWANSLTNADVLVVGQPLVVPPLNGIIYRVASGDTLETVAGRYNAKATDIAAFAPNGLGGGSPLVPGQDLFIPGGTPPTPAPAIIAAPPAEPAAAAAPEPSPPPAAAAPPAPAAGTSAVGSFIWPATGTLTTYFGDNPAYYGPGGHNGLDIANSQGTPLLAADGGVVIYSGWNGGLGNAIGIDHENGFVTWYGHASSLIVGKGARVSRGQVVALMGTTGNSTGSHIHFIIVKNGVYVDPLGYLRR
jgi:murein DD-endopeptidase MepM/ murein hydrolase activator NlpD